MKVLRVAAVQHYTDSNDPKVNAEKAIHFIKNAKEDHADILLFPECFLTSYQFPDICNENLSESQIVKDRAFAAWCDSALSEEDIHIERIREAARDHHIGVVITAFTKGRRFPQNSAYIIDRQGNIILKYSKVHTCDFSCERYVECGKAFRVCDFDGVKLGVMICYDREYPESARELMLQGAEIILVPNCCGSMMPRLRELSVRAMENMCGIVMANPNGSNMGCSCAFSPIVWDENGMPVDNTILVAGENYDGLVYADFNMDAIRRYRLTEDLGKYRKIFAYKNLTNVKDKNNG